MKHLLRRQENVIMLQIFRLKYKNVTKQNEKESYIILNKFILMIYCS